MLHLNDCFLCKIAHPNTWVGLGGRGAQPNVGLDLVVKGELSG